MKRPRKKHLIPLLIGLTAIAVTVGAYFYPRPTPLLPSPDKSKSTMPHYCEHMMFEGKNYIVCRADPQKDEIALFLNNDKSEPFLHFRSVEKMLNGQNMTLAFAMNAGMYHADFSAVGLYIENGKELYKLSTQDGPGNFHMKPNGVFFIKDRHAFVMDTQSFQKAKIAPDLATQSGPMLVIDNQIHQRFIPNSPFLEYRNGVGVNDKGQVYFVISETKVNFDEMARFFRDELKTPNALFLDGSISSLYAPDMKRYDWWQSLGPIIGVVVPKGENRDATATP